MEGSLYSLGDITPETPLVLIPCGPISKSKFLHLAKEESFSVHLLFLVILDWDSDLTPYPAKKPFSYGDFLGKGPLLLREIEEKILPKAYEAIGYQPKNVGILGYSLAGLFALWAFLSSSRFSSCASCSGSLWYPDFLEKIQQGSFPKKDGFAYLSLGDREKQSKNVVLQQIEEKTIAIKEALIQAGIRSCFEMNQGNHFHDPEGRMKKGLVAMLDDFGV